MEATLSIDRVLGTAWGIFKARLWRLVGTSALFVAACAVLGGVWAILLAVAPESARNVVAVVFGILLLVGFVAAALAYAGSIVRIVESAERGGDPGSVGDVLRSLRGRLWKMFWVTVIAWLGILVGMLLFIVPGVVLAVLWSVYLPVIVVEDLAFDSLARSRELVRGNALGVLGAHLVFAMLLYVVMILLFLVIFAVIAVVGLVGGSGLGGVAGVIAQVVLPLLMMPIGLVVGAVIYFELKALEGTRRSPGAAVLPETP